MTLFLVRYAELGLKSERVRRRFLDRLVKDLTAGLEKAGVDHIIELERGRIFVDCSDPGTARRVLRRTNGVQSFSLVRPCGASIDALMSSLSEYGKEMIRPGMTYGLRVKRAGSHPYTSQEIAAIGGGAVVSHLPEGSTRVDLKGPDVWIDVEIRENKAYIFSGKEKGVGGMPSDTQGRVLLYLPAERGPLVRERALLSYLMMARRGCTVVPVAISEEGWEDLLSRIDIRCVGIASPNDLGRASNVAGADGIVYPFDIGTVPEMDIHPRGEPIAEFYPTAGIADDEVPAWLERLS